MKRMVMKKIKYVLAVIGLCLSSSAVYTNNGLRFYAIEQLMHECVDSQTVVAATFLKNLKRNQQFQQFKKALYSQDKAESDMAIAMFNAVKQDLRVHLKSLKKEGEKWGSVTLGALGKSGLSIAAFLFSLESCRLHRGIKYGNPEEFKWYGISGLSLLATLGYSCGMIRSVVYENYIHNYSEQLKIIKDFWDTLPLESGELK